MRFTTPYGGKSALQERLYGTPSTARTAGSCGRSAAFTTALLSPACPSEPPNLGPKGGNLERRTKTGPAQIAGPHKSVFLAQRGGPILSAGTFPTPPHKIAHSGDKRATEAEPTVTLCSLVCGIPILGQFFSVLTFRGSGHSPECVQRIAGGYACLPMVALWVGSHTLYHIVQGIATL